MPCARAYSAIWQALLPCDGDGHDNVDGTRNDQGNDVGDDVVCPPCLPHQVTGIIASVVCVLIPLFQLNARIGQQTVPLSGTGHLAPYEWAGEH